MILKRGALIIVFLLVFSINGVLAEECAKDHCFDTQSGGKPIWGIAVGSPGSGCEVYEGFNESGTCPEGTICCNESIPSCERFFQGYLCVKKGNCNLMISEEKLNTCPADEQCCGDFSQFTQGEEECAPDHCIDLFDEKVGMTIWGVVPNEPDKSEGCFVYGGVDPRKSCPTGKICCQEKITKCEKEFGAKGFKCLPEAKCDSDSNIQRDKCPGGDIIRQLCCDKEYIPPPPPEPPPRYFWDTSELDLELPNELGPINIELFDSVAATSDPEDLNGMLKKIYEETLGLRIVIAITHGDFRESEWIRYNLAMGSEKEMYDIAIMYNIGGLEEDMATIKRAKYEADSKQDTQALQIYYGMFYTGKMKKPPVEAELESKETVREIYDYFLKFVREGNYRSEMPFCHYCNDAKKELKEIFGEETYKKCRGVCCKAPCPPNTIMSADDLKYYNMCDYATIGEKQGSENKPYCEGGKFADYKDSDNEDANCCARRGADGRSYCSAACGPTSFRMALSAIGKDDEISHKYLWCSWSTKRVYEPGGGIAYYMKSVWKKVSKKDSKIFSDGVDNSLTDQYDGREIGYNGKVNRGSSYPEFEDLMPIDEIISSIKEGPIILNIHETGKGRMPQVKERCYKTSYGHFIILVGVTSDGEYFIVNEPYTPNGCAISFGERMVMTKDYFNAITDRAIKVPIR